MPVDSTIPDPSSSSDPTWKADHLDPWIADVSGTIATLEAGTSASLPVKNVVDHYGVNPSGTATSITAAVNAAMADHATWSTLQIPDMLSINGPIDESVMYGKIIEGFGREDTGFEQTGSNMAIVRTAGSLVHSVVWRNIHLAYQTQQTFASHPNSIAFEFRATTAGDQSQWWRRYQNMRITKATYGFNTTATAGSAPPWGSVWDDVLLTSIGHCAMRIAPGAGTPSIRVRNMHVSNGGVTSTGPCIELVGVEGHLELDLEEWRNTILIANGGCNLVLSVPHLENDYATGTSTKLFQLANQGSTTILGGNLYLTDSNLSGVVTFFDVNDNHTLLLIGTGYGIATITAGGAYFSAGDGTASIRTIGVHELVPSAAGIYYPAQPWDANAVAQIKQTNNWMQTPQVTVTSAYTVPLTVDTVFANAAGGAFTVTLPAAAERPGRTITITRTSASNTVTVDADAAELINSAATATLSTQWASMTVQSYGTGWAIVSTSP
jgi:hypothetical protein